MSTQRPKSISFRELSKAVDAATKQVAEKHKLKFGNELVLQPGTLIGRQLLEAVALEKALEAAGEITKAVGGAHAELARPGGNPEPAVLARPGILICGFLPEPPIEFRE
jgi:hypothetical protein